MLDLDILQKTAATRSDRWHDTPESKWSLLEWAGAMCGEAGEAANYAKKLKRLQTQMRNLDKRGLKSPSIEDQSEFYKRNTCLEAADAIVYAVSVINEAGGSVEEVVREVFNNKSAEYGFPERV